MKQAREGGSWQVQVSLAGVGHWLRTLGRTPGDFDAVTLPPADPYLAASDSGFGRLLAVRHAARFSHTPAGWELPSVPPGTDAPRW